MITVVMHEIHNKTLNMMLLLDSSPFYG